MMAAANIPALARNFDTAAVAGMAWLELVAEAVCVVGEVVIDESSAIQPFQSWQ